MHAWAQGACACTLPLLAAQGMHAQISIPAAPACVQEYEKAGGKMSSQSKEALRAALVRWRKHWW